MMKYVFGGFQFLWTAIAIAELLKDRDSDHSFLMMTVFWVGAAILFKLDERK